MASSLGYIKKGAVHLSELEMYFSSPCNKAFLSKSHLQRNQKSTHRQSSGFLLSSMQPTLLQKRLLKETSHQKTYR